MAHDEKVASVRAERMSSALQRVLRRLPVGTPERQAIDAGEIDAVIDYDRTNVIVFPAARRALRDAAPPASGGERKVALETLQRNRILAALPRAECRRMWPALEPIELEPGDVLHEAGDPVRHVYFPVDCVVCLLTPVDSQQAVATGLVGHHGMVGLQVTHTASSSVRAVVRVAGSALRMSATRFLNEFQRSPQLRVQLYRQTNVELNLARQTAACSASHGLEQRLARWLMMIGDRARSREMRMTHEQIANDLNVRRESVTAGCVVLCSRGLIGQGRGRISILDRTGLEQVSCRCFKPIKSVDAAQRVKGPDLMSRSRS